MPNPARVRSPAGGRNFASSGKRVRYEIKNYLAINSVGHFFIT
jgi:hypothetical protein